MGILLDIVSDEQLCDLMCGKPEDSMKYIIMAGRPNPEFKEPRQLFQLNKEPVIVRTIRLLREAGVDDIAISSNDKRFEGFGVEVLHHENKKWLDAFYPTDEPVCYIFGDVVFSHKAIEKIVFTDTDDIEFFASSPPFSKHYIKKWAEPFAFKVRDQEHFREAINLCNDFAGQKLFKRPPIAWELWQVIKQTPLNEIDYTNYCSINDYTCDIDEPLDAMKLQARIIECHDT